MGIGITIIVEEEKASKILEYINKNTDDKAYIIGKIVKNESQDKRIDIK